MLAERTNVEQRFKDLFPDSFPFQCKPLRLVTDNNVDYNISYGGQCVTWCSETDCCRIISNIRFRRSAFQNLCQLGQSKYWFSTSESDNKLKEVYNLFQKQINQVITKLLIAAGTNRTDILPGQSVSCICTKEMIKRYNITDLCIPSDYDIGCLKLDTDIPIHRLGSFNHIIGLSIPDYLKSPLVFYFKDFGLFQDNNVGMEEIGVYGWLEGAFAVHDSNCVFLSSKP